MKYSITINFDTMQELGVILQDMNNTLNQTAPARLIAQYQMAEGPPIQDDPKEQTTEPAEILEITKKCEECGTEYTTKGVVDVFCSYKCYNRQYQRAYYA